MTGICDGRVVIVTGAGRGLGRAHALEFARQGARVVVNDIGAELDGTGGSASPARDVVDEIVAAGGEAVVNGDDVADWSGAQRLVGTAVDTFGRLDVLVNNAGFVRDRMVVSCEEDEWDAGGAGPPQGATSPCPASRPSTGGPGPRPARPSTPASSTPPRAPGCWGPSARAAYSAAKAGIATLTLVQAAELGRYGVTANAIAPSARTRMTETVFATSMAAPDDPATFDAMAPENVGPAGGVAGVGRVGRRHRDGCSRSRAAVVSLADGWQHGPASDKGARWEPAELGPVVEDLLARAPDPAPVYGRPERLTASTWRQGMPLYEARSHVILAWKGSLRFSRNQ
jgi:NAD(P)-dependent dehydrogenase (short-subunit alcohol dehydrogenase family)